MKLEIRIDPRVDETLVQIFASAMNREVERIQKLLEPSSLEWLTGMNDDDVVVLEPKAIVRFFTQDKKVFIRTEQGQYLTRLRLYELEERFAGGNFIRISQAEIINLDYVKRLDLSYKGTIGVELKTGEVSFVSRRSLQNFKTILGL